MISATINIETVLKVAQTKNPRYESVLALIRTDYANDTSGVVPLWVTAPAGSLPVGKIELSVAASIRVGKQGRLSIFVRSIPAKASKRA